MRTLNYVIGALIGIGALAMSAYHTFNMFDRLGDEPIILVYGIMGAVELNFVLALINGIHSRIHGHKPGGGYWVAFGAGTLLVWWSNVSAWVTEWSLSSLEAFLLGTSIPVLIWTSESIISRQIINDRTAKQQQAEEEKTVVQIEKEPDDTPETAENIGRIEVVNQVKENDTPEEESDTWEPVPDPVGYFVEEEKRLQLG